MAARLCLSITLSSSRSSAALAHTFAAPARQKIIQQIEARKRKKEQLQLHNKKHSHNHNHSGAYISRHADSRVHFLLFPAKKAPQVSARENTRKTKRQTLANKP
jgi:hypothetical protein